MAAEIVGFPYLDQRPSALSGARSGPCRRSLAVAALLLLAVATLPAFAQQKIEVPTPTTGLTQAWQGDFDGMRERRLIRVLVVPSQTMYFYDDGEPKGIAHEMLVQLEKVLNKKYKPAKRHLGLHVVVIPSTLDQLIPRLLAGEADLVAGPFTVTPQRQAQVDFSAPLATGIDEIVVTGPGGPTLQGLDDLAGQEVLVRPSSSYHEHLVALNAQLAGRGLAPVRIRAAPEDLDDESMLEMVDAGLIPLVVVDGYKARLWAKVLERLVLHPDIAIHSGGEFAWMMRKGSPLLKAEIDAFAKAHGKGTTFGNVVIKRYLGSTRYLRNALDDAGRRRFEQTLELFRSYGDRYGLDHLLVMAQSYQESGLDHSVKSPVGAIGIMQVMPTTGAELGVGDITALENNVHAGVKYLRFMIDRYFADEPMSDGNKLLFAFASYNAGPARVARLRSEAAELGLDPNRWFGNVEVVAARRIGSETVRYVGNIYKYYVAYRLLTEQQQREKAARERVAPKR
jgi:membrane-bound lytic murein transglycosylase MltF